MSSPTFSTAQSPGDGSLSEAARLYAVLQQLLTAQAELDALDQPLAAARLDATIEAVNLAIISGDTD